MDIISDRVCSSLKVREEAFGKLATGDYKAAFIQFLEDADTMRLLVYLDGKDLVAANKPPAKLRKKTIFFIKTVPGKLDNESFKKNVIHGEIGESALESLALVSQDVFMPLLTSTANQQGWPDVVAKEVTENLHKFVSNVQVTIGQTKGQTVLTLPAQSTLPGSASSHPASTEPISLKDQEKIHILESAIVTWTKQIKTVLKASADAPAKDAKYPGPLAELGFWSERASNLNSIHEQLSGDKIQKVVKILELAKSTYYPAFQRLFHEVEAARFEANDNVKFLKPLKKYLEKLNMLDEFTALVDLFKPIMHTLLLIWKGSKHYGSPRFVTLVTEICNDLIMQACKFIPGADLIQMDPSEATEKLRLAIRILANFKQQFFYFDFSKVSPFECRHLMIDENCSPSRRR